LPGQTAERIKLDKTADVPQLLYDFMQRFEVKEAAAKPVNVAQGLFGYTTFDAVQFFDSIKTTDDRPQTTEIPLVRYRLYQYVIAINHFKDELFICENHFNGIESEVGVIESLIKSKDVPGFPFKSIDEERSNITDAAYIEMVKKGVAS
jgi:anthranilate synthase component 1